MFAIGVKAAASRGPTLVLLAEKRVWGSGGWDGGGSVACGGLLTRVVHAMSSAASYFNRRLFFQGML
jgi:hypothetical protein